MAKRPRITSKGTCALCKTTLNKSAMTKHLQSCLGKNQIAEVSTEGASSSLKFFHLFVEGQYLPAYWMHLKVSSHARFEDLDNFLREIWLECCGHMSAFSIGREEVRKSKKLEYVLQHGMQLDYVYDFGSSTELRLGVISEFRSSVKKTHVEILARNNPPQIKCSHCDNVATRICAECIYAEAGWLCNDCAENHKCGENMLLPVVNSPRTGVCGYVG